ncbi:hypothetical protein N7456_003654 [Penicillium angulare]|uniref:Uncharacterized protein n=1 Tax=Penicillium angulare TaxID=116970 RepID=A0A9W9KHP2_9EURO|nr:hypothetical protein N7456_003654 [Penicillium angulare]
MPGFDGLGLDGGANKSRANDTILAMNCGVREICAADDAKRFLSWRSFWAPTADTYRNAVKPILYASLTNPLEGRPSKNLSMPKNLPVVDAYLTPDDMELDRTLPPADDHDIAMIVLVNTFPMRERGVRCTANFDTSRNIRANRVLLGKPVIFVWRGLPWIPAYGRYSILGGSDYD